MSGRKSRNKGARGEREWAKFLTDKGFFAHRGRQYQGGADSPDVVCKALGGISFEVKRVENFSAYDALLQSTTDAGERIPIVAHRKNGKPWIVVLDADVFFERFIKLYVGELQEVLPKPEAKSSRK